jgi:hypothetical protein
MDDMRRGPINPFLPPVVVRNVNPHLANAVVQDVARRYPPGTVVDVVEIHRSACPDQNGGRCTCPHIHLEINPTWGGDIGIPGPYPQLMCMN